MRFFIKRPFKYKGKQYSRRDKYVEMPYEDGRPLIRRGKIMLSKQQDEVKDDKEISKKSKPDAPKRGVSVSPGKRTRRTLKQV